MENMFKNPLLLAVQFDLQHFTKRKRKQGVINQLDKLNFKGRIYRLAGLEKYKTLLFDEQLEFNNSHDKTKVNWNKRLNLAESPPSSSSYFCSCSDSCWNSCVALLPPAPTTALHRSPLALSSPCSSFPACQCADWASESSPSNKEIFKTLYTCTPEGKDRCLVAGWLMS